MILDNRRITVREVAEDLKISIGSCHSIFINDLGMRRVAAKFVPKLLNCDQKQHRMKIANEMLDSVRDDPNLLQRVITGDEAWVYGYEVETKAQSSQWKLPHEPRPKKARQVQSNVKVLLTVFFDCRGVVHHEFLPQARTVNKEYYLQVMRNLREAIRQKRPNLWKNKNWLLHHDNAPAHTSLLVRDFLAKNNTLMMPQPPYSPDLVPCNFLLFPKLKRPMKGRRYATLDEIKTASKEELKNIFKNEFLKCFEDWKNRWHKCIISHGDYFEGDKIEISRLKCGKASGVDDVPNDAIKARLARFVWGASRVSWLPWYILARPVSDGGVGLLDIAGQLRLSCLKGVQATLRGAANGYSWLVLSRAWLTPPASDVWLLPRRRRLLSFWEAASSVLELDHRIIHPASLRSLRLRGDNRFLRPPDLLAPERWLQATVEDFSYGAPALARSTRAALLDE
ncbi:hypothetical protein LAZ67_3002462 [Cordylochernes scorpioides]|uniref:Mariner Mos1 transposase n=1 Tax=Cordylochernes scorpioides TaxID=51811 RepID=A0ABY6KB56_9ARAC|nr:hypothetical protein LAZ67_3002462 [Cordylochernes scorpioides]